MPSSRIVWRDGIEIAPSGKEVREVFTKYSWASTLWVSADGECWRRFYNVVSQAWSWDADGPLEYQEELSKDGITGRVGLKVDNAFRDIKTLIALAWRHRSEGTLARTVHTVEDKPISLDTVDWEHAELNREMGAFSKETWKPISKRRRVGIVPITPGYEISSQGRLKSPFSNKITRGHWVEGACGPTRVAAVRNTGLVDLWDCAKLIEPAKLLPPAIRLAANALMTGKSPAQHAKNLGIAVDTCWSYFRRAAQHLPRSRLLELAQELVSPDLWRFLVLMRDSDDDRLAGSLTYLMELVREELSAKSRFWNTASPMGMLAFGRQCLVAQG